MGNDTETLKIVIAIAEEASARAASARAAAPKPRRLIFPVGEQRTALLTANAMEAQERAAWAFACRTACDEVGDAQTEGKIDAHMVWMGTPVGEQWVMQPPMATQHLREYAMRALSDLEQSD